MWGQGGHKRHGWWEKRLNIIKDNEQEEARYATVEYYENIIMQSSESDLDTLSYINTCRIIFSPGGSYFPSTVYFMYMSQC